jgi:hypothetical protein
LWRFEQGQAKALPRFRLEKRGTSAQPFTRPLGRDSSSLRVRAGAAKARTGECRAVVAATIDACYFDVNLKNVRRASGSRFRAG